MERYKRRFLNESWQDEMKKEVELMRKTYSAEEQQKIRDIISSAKSASEAIKQIQAEVPGKGKKFK